MDPNTKQIFVHSFILKVNAENKRLNACGHAINKRSNPPAITKLHNNQILSFSVLGEV